MRRKVAAGNWKMNGTKAELAEIDALVKLHPDPRTEVLICPPATLLASAVEHCADLPVAIGAQDCHAASAGAHTGDISGQMIVDTGARHVIVGHSERRANHGERSEGIRAKTNAAWDAGLTVILCVGESLAQREVQNTLDIIGAEMSMSIPDQATGHNLIMAYEPIWAIGTGRIPTMEQIGEVHDFMRSRLERRFGAGVGRSVRLLYGGSVKPANAAEIFSVTNVDGALVGGASLKAQDFAGIISALEEAA